MGLLFGCALWEDLLLGFLEHEAFVFSFVKRFRTKEVVRNCSYSSKFINREWAVITFLSIYQNPFFDSLESTKVFHSRFRMFALARLS